MQNTAATGRKINPFQLKPGHFFLTEDVVMGISIIPLLHFRQDIWIFLQEIRHEPVLAAKRPFHQLEGMRLTCKNIASPHNSSQIVSTDPLGGPVKQSGALSPSAALLGNAPMLLIPADLHILLHAVYQSNMISLRNRQFHCPHFCVDCPQFPHA